MAPEPEQIPSRTLSDAHAFIATARPQGRHHAA
jgi:hypothetical protein